MRHYFQGPKLNLLPAALQPSVFDMQVNAGSNAVRILQRLMAAFGLPLKDDGIIGPITARTVARAMEMAPDHLVDAYGIARRNYYYKLADERPTSRKYARQPRRRQGRLDRARRGVHLRALPADARPSIGRGPRHGRDRQHPRAPAPSKSVGAAVEAVAEACAPRARRRSPAAIGAYGAEFAGAGGSRFDGFVNGLNRLPRPLLALSTLGLFGYAMAEPAGFGTRMQSLALVPEPLWWLLGAIVSFYFGARELHHQRTRTALTPRGGRPASRRRAPPGRARGAGGAGRDRSRAQCRGRGVAPPARLTAHAGRASGRQCPARRASRLSCAASAGSLQPSQSKSVARIAASCD